MPKNNSLTNYFDYNLRLMNKNSYFINERRGDTVNEVDLYFVLKQKLIRGVNIDVFKEEPLKKTNKLFKLKNHLILPHSAGWFNSYWMSQTNVLYNLLLI